MYLFNIQLSAQHDMKGSLVHEPFIFKRKYLHLNIAELKYRHCKRNVIYIIFTTIKKAYMII